MKSVNQTLKTFNEELSKINKSKPLMRLMNEMLITGEVHPFQYSGWYVPKFFDTDIRNLSNKIGLSLGWRNYSPRGGRSGYVYCLMDYNSWKYLRIEKVFNRLERLRNFKHTKFWRTCEQSPLLENVNTEFNYDDFSYARYNNGDELLLFNKNIFVGKIIIHCKWSEYININNCRIYLKDLYSLDYEEIKTYVSIYEILRNKHTRGRDKNSLLFCPFRSKVIM